MKAGMLLLIMRDVVNVLLMNNVLDVDGNFSSPNVETDLKLAADVEHVLKARGLDTPDKIDKIIQALPLFLEVVR